MVLRSPTFTLEQPRFAYSEMATAFAGKPPASGTGAITVIIPIDQEMVPPGLVVALDPPVAVADYGTGSVSFPDDCRVRIGCSDDNPCPSGSRCDGNECLHGAAPDCQHCTADYACPSGYIEQFDSDSQCFCVQEVGSCLTDACAGDGEVCWSRPAYSNESGLHDVCLPWNHTTDHAFGWARFANVPPGIYTLRGTSTDPSFFFLPTQVRIDAAPNLYAHVALLWGTK